MFEHVVYYPTGDMVIYYTTKRIIIPKSGVPITEMRIYNKKEADGFFNGPPNVLSSSDSLSRH